MNEKYNLPSKRLWRTLARVEWHNNYRVEFAIPAFDRDSVVIFMRILPPEIREAVIRGQPHFHVMCNIGAEHAEELFFQDWEIG